MRGMVEALFLEPAEMAGIPCRLERKDTTVLQHESADLLPVNTLRFDRSGTGADEITHRLMTCLRHSHRRQLTGAQ